MGNEEITRENQAVAKNLQSSQSGKLLSVSGALLTVVSWVMLIINGLASLCFCGAALVLSSLAVRKTKHGWRNLAITSVVASGVLMLVLAIFYVVIDIVIKSL